MKKIFRLIALATAFGAALSGCTLTEETGQTGKNEIKFSATVGSFQVKATDTAFDALDAIGLFADEPVYAYNVKLTYENGKLTPEEPIYWGSYQLLEQPTYFYAYYPYDADRDGMEGRHSVAKDQSTPEALSASDFMVAKALSAPADGAVQLNFAHAYSKIVFTVENLVDDVAVESVHLGNVALSARGVAGDIASCWSDFDVFGEVKTAPVTTAADEPAWACIIPPQSAFPIVLVVMKDGRQYAFNSEKEVYFNPSLRYNAKIVIDETTVSADFAYDITDWIDSGDITFGQFRDYGVWYCMTDENYWGRMYEEGKTVRYTNIEYHAGEVIRFYSDQENLYYGVALSDGAVLAAETAYPMAPGEYENVGFTLPQEGYWNLVINAAAKTVTAYYTGGFPVTENWTLVGTIYGGDWNTDYELTPYADEINVFYTNLTYHVGEEFKLRKDGAWAENFGINNGGKPLQSDNEYALTADGDNITLPEDGIWYIAVSINDGWLYCYRMSDIPDDGYELTSVQDAVDVPNNTEVQVTNVVYATTTRGFMLFDGKYSIFVYAAGDPGVGPGDVVRVSGTKTTYNGVPEITNPVWEVLGHEYLMDLSYYYEDITSYFDSYTAGISTLISFEGVLGDNAYIMTVEGAETQGNIYYATSDLGLSGFIGHKIRVNGFYNGRNKNNQLSIVVTEVSEDWGIPEPEPELNPIDLSISIADGTLSANWAAVEGAYLYGWSISNEYEDLLMDGRTFETSLEVDVTELGAGNYIFQIFAVTADGNLLALTNVDFAISGEDPEPMSNPFESNVTWSLISAAYDDNTLNVTIDGNTFENVPNVKLGTSSKVGSFSITVPAGTTSLSFWAAAWKGSDATLVVTYGETTAEITVPANVGAAGSKPYNMTVDGSNAFYLYLGVIEEDTVITFETTTSAYRAFVFGIQALDK